MRQTGGVEDLDPTPDLVLRAGGPDDLAAVAEIHVRARREAVPAMPPSVHPDHETRAWVAGWDLATTDLWIAEDAGRVVGYAHLTPTWLDGLYVHPDAQGAGVGSALLDLAKGLRPDGFGLWVFESNEPARRFYRRHGLVELERTDGAGNEERVPDVRMLWPGTDPLTCFRRQIDEVDDALGDLLARRTALTRAVQDHKRRSGSGALRDPAREAEVVRRVAARSPALDEAAVARIVDAVITAGLEAGGH